MPSEAESERAAEDRAAASNCGRGQTNRPPPLSPFALACEKSGVFKLPFSLRPRGNNQRTSVLTIRIGTRASQLAQWQANWVCGQLRQHGLEVEIVLLSTEGDVSTESLGMIGGQGVFTKSIQRALLADQVDLAVHSLKDLPTQSVEGLSLIATPPRERSGDVLVSNRFSAFDELPPKARVGTGSARRGAQLRHRRPDLQILDIRGNVGTRLQKLDDGEFDAVILAEAGLHRLELTERIRQVLPKVWMLPAIGQGALGLETRCDDTTSQKAALALNDMDTFAAITAERAMLRSLQAGCLAPVGAWCRLDSATLVLDAVVLDPLGEQRIATRLSGPPCDAEEIGAQAADLLLTDGAEPLIR